MLFLIAAGGGARTQRPLEQRRIAALARRLDRCGFLLLPMAFRVYIGRFELLFEHHTIFDGVSYTDAHVTLTGMLVVCLALLIGAVIAIAGGIARPRGVWLLAAIAPAIVCYAAVAWPAGT